MNEELKRGPVGCVHVLLVDREHVDVATPFFDLSQRKQPRTFAFRFIVVLFEVLHEAGAVVFL